MTEVWLVDQPIAVSVNSDGRPVQFAWRATTYLVREIVEWWQVDTDWWRTEGRVWCDFYAVITDAELFCVICFDRLRAEWRLIRMYG